MRYQVSIPVLVKLHPSEPSESEPKEHALAIHYEIAAPSELEAARIVAERLEALIADDPLTR